MNLTTKLATGLGQVCEVQVWDLRAAGVGGALREQDARVQERTHKRKEQGWWSFRSICSHEKKRKRVGCMNSSPKEFTEPSLGLYNTVLVFSRTRTPRPSWWGRCWRRTSRTSWPWGGGSSRTAAETWDWTTTTSTSWSSRCGRPSSKGWAT